MASYPGVYRAKAVSLNGTKLTAFIPQVFGDTSVVIEDYIGALGPTGMGWVAFHGGNCEMPVWMGAENNDDRYVSTSGDEMSDTLIITQLDASPNISLRKTGTNDVDGAIYIEILSAGSPIGRITRATSTTAGFLTTSDKDLKQNMVPVEDDLALLWMRTIEPYFFEYTDKVTVRHVGYSAQEVAELWPNGVLNGIITPGHGDIKNRRWNESGQEITDRKAWSPWMMDHGKITPILHAGMLAMDRIQTARTILLADHAARITVLESKVATLETQNATQASQITALQQLAATHTAQISTLLQTTALHTTQIAKLSNDMNTNSIAIGQLRSDVFFTRRSTAFWQYANQLVGPPGTGQMRVNAAITTMWLHKIDTDGFDRVSQLEMMLLEGAEFVIRGATGRVFTVHTTGLSTDNGTYYTVPITLVSGSAADKGFRVEITQRTGIWAQPPPPVVTTLPVLPGTPVFEENLPPPEDA